MSYHLYKINEVFSDATGKIQFIEMSVGPDNNESFWEGVAINVMQGEANHIFTFPRDLPSRNTANTSVLIATQGFANLGIVNPDFIIPDGFLFTYGEAAIHFDHVDMVTYTALPLNGVQSIDRNEEVGINSPKNFAGVTGTIQSNLIIGTNGADNLTGTAEDNTIQAAAGNDNLNGLLGNDSLDGGEGIDTSIYSGNRAAYAITGSTPEYFSLAGPEGNDILTSMERLDFQDSNIAFDLTQGQSAGNTVRLIGAAFDTNNIIPEFVAIGLQLFDSGKSMLEVSDLVINSPLFISMVDSSSNVDFVNFVFKNVVGVLPTSSERDSFVELLQGNGGTMSQAELIAIAANSDMNETNIGLLGLIQTGVEYSG